MTGIDLGASILKAVVMAMQCVLRSLAFHSNLIRMTRVSYSI
jgi:hypothetical protein